MGYYTEKDLNNIKKGLEYAKANPDDDFSKDITKRLREGKLNFELKALGLNPVPTPKPKVDLKKAMADVEMEKARQSRVPEQSRAEKQVSGAASDIGEDFLQMGQNIKEGFTERTERVGQDIARRREGGTTLRESIGTGLGFANAALGTVFDAIGEAGMFAAKSLMTPEQEAAVSDNFQKGVAAGLEATEGTAARDKVEQMIAAYNAWAEENPEDAANVRDVSGLMLSLAEGAGLKVGSSAAREAADVAADTIQRTAPAVKQGVETTARAGQEALEGGARRLGETVDTAMEGRRARQMEAQQAKVNKAVERITQAGADERAKTAAREALTEIDATNIKTYQDLNNALDDQISVLSRKVDEELDRYPEPRSLDELSKTVQVGDEVVTEQPVRSALDGLEEAYTKTGESANAARIRQLRQKAESEGLSLRELNELAREYGIEFRERAFTKTGDIKTGFNAENYENTRKSLKEVLRSQMPDDVTRDIDRRISNIYTTRDLTRKIEDRVAKLQQRVKDRTLAQRLGGTAASILDMTTGGALRGFVARMLPSNMGNKAMNSIEIQDELQANLKELDRMLQMQDDKKFADAFEKWAQEMQPGMSIKSSVQPDQVVKQLTDEQIDTLRAYRQNPANTQVFPEAQRILEDIGATDYAEPEMENRFIDDVLSEFDQMTDRDLQPRDAQGRFQSKKDKSATTKTTDLIEEAKKYDSAEPLIGMYERASKPAFSDYKKFVKNEVGAFVIDETTKEIKPVEVKMMKVSDIGRVEDDANFKTIEDAQTILTNRFPVVIDESTMKYKTYANKASILDGNNRVASYRAAGVQEIPVYSVGSKQGLQLKNIWKNFNQDDV